MINDKGEMNNERNAREKKKNKTIIQMMTHRAVTGGVTYLQQSMLNNYLGVVLDFQFQMHLIHLR